MKIFALFLVVLTIASCKTSTNAIPAPEVSSKRRIVKKLKVNCITPNRQGIEIFKVIERPPELQSGHETIVKVLQSACDEIDINRINYSEIKIEVLVLDMGEACLSEVVIDPEIDGGILVELRNAIENRCSWVPGVQGGIIRNAYAYLNLRVENGEVKLLN